MKSDLPKCLMSVLLVLGAGFVQAEPFEAIKADLASAAGLRIYFVSQVESAVFESVDSFPGQAHICSDGRYSMRIGSDQFLFDGDKLYSYSEENNQVTIERMTSGDPIGDQVTFISRLNEHFLTTSLPKPGHYLLVRKETSSEALPDSLTVVLDSQLTRMSQISYYDINEDINRILIDSILYLEKCDSTRLFPDFPDSVEVVRLF